MASREDHAASRRCLPAMLIAVLMTSVGSSNSMDGSRSSGGSSCTHSSPPGHPLQRSPTSTTPPQAWHPPPRRQARARGTTTAATSATACFFHHHYRWRSTNLPSSSSFCRPHGHPASPRLRLPRACGEQRTTLAVAARRRPPWALGTTDDATRCGSGAVRRGGSRGMGSSGRAALAAVAGDREMRAAEGPAALAAGAVERRTNGHDSATTTATTSSSSVEMSGFANPVASAEVYREGGDEAGETARHQSLLSRGMAATERFFASDRRPKQPRAGREEIEGLGAKELGLTGEQERKAAAAKLEGEQEARDQEGLRTVPRHVAFVMDGNGRWAASRNLPRGTGHAEGARRAGEAVEACRQLGVEFVTLYAFSTENWRRPDGEVSFLMDLMEKTLVEQRDGLRRNGIRLTAIGELDRLPERLRSLLREIEEDSGSSGSGSGNTPEANGAPTVGATSAIGVPSGPPSTGIPAAPRVEGAAREFPREPRGEEGVRAGAGVAFSLAGGSAISLGLNDGDQGLDPVPPLNTAPAPSPSTTTTTPAASEVPLPPPPPPPPPTAVPIPTTMTLCLAISYGGRSELAAAARELAAEAAAGRLDPRDIDEVALGRRLSTARLGIPDPDLVVRTSGESRLSNLLVWQSAYSELCVVEKAWPDFRRLDLVEAFRDFGRRRRRFGKTPEQIAEAP
ncbi:unnamed protein product [Scytosiphon promiscuus]